jgi:hypothetical protein
LKNKREKVIVKSVIYVSIFYFLLYDYFSLTLRPEDFTRSGGGFISASGDRAARIALEPAITCLGYYLGLSGLRRGHNVKLSLFVLLISVLAIFLSQSRGLTATILSISLMYAFFPNKRLAYSISLWVFLSSTVIMVVLFALNINIYGLGPDDLSLYARMHELQTIIQGFGDYPIFGRGFYNPIPTDKNIYVDYNTAVFWNDMGVYGILWAAGSVGLVLFVGLSVAIMRSNTLIVDIGLSPILADAMLLSFATCGAQGFTAPIFWTSGITLVTFYLAFVSTRLTIHRIRDRIA